MKKDKKWFINKWTKERDKTDVHDPMYHFINEFITDVRLLDEPEVSAKDSIDKNKEDSDVQYKGYCAPIGRVHNPILPTQELPVIPKYVVEFIEEVKASGDRLDDAFSILRGIYHQSKTADWVAKENRNSETFAKAWLSGYEAEEEPLYYALIKGHELITDKGVSTCKYWNFNTYNSDVFPNNRLSKHGIYLTKMSKEDWNELGINDSNADFVKVV